MARVHLPAATRRLTHGLEQIELEATTVRQLIRELDRRFPGVGSELPRMAVAIDGEIIQDALLERLSADSEVHFLPPIGGG